MLATPNKQYVVISVQLIVLTDWLDRFVARVPRHSILYRLGIWSLGIQGGYLVMQISEWCILISDLLKCGLFMVTFSENDMF